MVRGQVTGECVLCWRWRAARGARRAKKQRTSCSESLIRSLHNWKHPSIENNVVRRRTTWLGDVARPGPEGGGRAGWPPRAPNSLGPRQVCTVYTLLDWIASEFMVKLVTSDSCSQFTSDGESTIHKDIVFLPVVSPSIVCDAVRFFHLWLSAIVGNLINPILSLFFI